MKEFDNQMQRTKLVAGEEKPGYIPPDDEGANTGPDNLQKMLQRRIYLRQG